MPTDCYLFIDKVTMWKYFYGSATSLSYHCYYIWVRPRLLPPSPEYHFLSDDGVTVAYPLNGKYLSWRTCALRFVDHLSISRLGGRWVGFRFANEARIHQGFHRWLQSTRAGPLVSWLLWFSCNASCRKRAHCHDRPSFLFRSLGKNKAIIRFGITCSPFGKEWIIRIHDDDAKTEVRDSSLENDAVVAFLMTATSLILLKCVWYRYVINLFFQECILSPFCLVTTIYNKAKCTKSKIWSTE